MFQRCGKAFHGFDSIEYHRLADVAPARSLRNTRHMRLKFPNALYISALVVKAAAMQREGAERLVPWQARRAPRELRAAPVSGCLRKLIVRSVSVSKSEFLTVYRNMNGGSML